MFQINKKVSTAKCSNVNQITAKIDCKTITASTSTTYKSTQNNGRH
jgi:hypothetical protein